MDFCFDKLIEEIENTKIISMIVNAKDIALIEEDEDYCYSEIFAQVLDKFQVNRNIVKEILIFGRNKAKLMRERYFLQDLFTEANIIYLGENHALYKAGTIGRMLNIHFRTRIAGKTSKNHTDIPGIIDHVIIVRKIGYDTELLNPYNIFSAQPLKTIQELPTVIAKKLPEFCLERRESLEKLFKHSYLEAAFNQCRNEITNGCNECPECTKYGDSHLCPYFQFQLSEFYRKGIYVPQSDAIAHNLAKKSANQGFSPAVIQVAKDYIDGIGCEIDLTSAERILTPIAEAGNVESAKMLAELYTSTDKEYRSFPWIARLAKSGNHNMQNRMIDLYSSGIRGMNKDETQVQEWVKVAIKSGNTEYIKSLAEETEEQGNWDEALKWYCLIKDNDNEIDYTEKIDKIFLKTIEGLSAEDIAHKGDNHYLGIDCDFDYRRAYLCYTKAADLGLAYGLSGQAKCLEHGYGVEQDEEKSKELWLEAAERGDVYGLLHMFEDPSDSENPWLEDLRSALDEGVKNRDIRAIMVKANQLIYGKGLLYELDYNQAYELYKTAMNFGDAVAIRMVGMCYCHGYGVEIDDNKAQELFVNAANRGVASAMRCLGCSYEHGYGDKTIDKSKSYDWYKAAADRDDAKSQNHLGLYYEQKNDIKQANYWWLRAAENGNSESQYKISNNLYWGKGIEKDYKQARKWTERAADAGETRAYFRTAYMCNAGQGGPKDYTKAFKLYSTLAENNDYAAMNNLGVMYASGKGITTNQTKASELYLKAAEHGDEVAMHNIAVRYLNGTGIEKSFSNYLLWLNKGLSAESERCAFDLGDLYRDGNSNEGIDSDIWKAISHYEKVLEICKDDIENEWHKTALMRLADIYFNGRGVEENNELALKYHKIAAEAGVTEAYYKMGLHYHNGYGVDADTPMAIFWYRKAAEKGYSSAISKLEELGADYLTENEDEIDEY